MTKLFFKKTTIKLLKITQKDFSPNKQFLLAKVLKNIRNDEVKVDEERITDLLKLKQIVQELKMMNFNINAQTNIQVNNCDFRTNPIRIMRCATPETDFEQISLLTNAFCDFILKVSLSL